MLLLEEKDFWISPGGNQVNAENFEREARDLIRQGSKVYVGTDSMMHGQNCIFVTVVAFHDNDKRIGKYFYKKLKIENLEYRNLS